MKYYSNHKILHIIIKNYKIDNVDYSYLPHDLKCDFLSLDILFICLPTDVVLYFKNIFSKSNILINEIICCSYAKSINYKDDLNLTGYTTFIDVGFNRLSIISYFNDKILSFDILPIGGNHITKDISKILKLDLRQSEQMKHNFGETFKFSSNEDIQKDTLQKVIFARTDEMIELCIKSIKSNSYTLDKPKVSLMGAGLKIFNDKKKDKISQLSDLNILRETSEYICQSGFKFINSLNKQEVVVIPKKHIKKGFFESFFHFFQ